MTSAATSIEPADDKPCLSTDEAAALLRQQVASASGDQARQYSAQARRPANSVQPPAASRLGRRRPPLRSLCPL